MNSYRDTVLTHRSEVSQPTLLQTSSSGSAPFLPAVVAFFDALNAQGIRYCHWKSNIRLDSGLAGCTDLDLLIDPEHELPFKLLLEEYYIKLLLAPVAKCYPGIEHYLGFDSQTGRLFHLHVHFSLVLGEQYIKNYRLPFEKQFLDKPRFYNNVKIPSAELELIVLTLRALLKYRDRDVIKDILSIRSPGIPAYIFNEVIWLLEQTSLEQVASTLRTLPLDMDPDVILGFLKTMSDAPRSGYTLFLLRSHVRKMLQPYQRRSRLRASLDYYKQAGRKMLIQRSAPDRQLMLPDGGMMIALIGVDGAGKSTFCDKLTNWLSWKVDTHFYYMGSKQPSVLTTWSYMLFRMARRGHRELSALWGEGNFLARWTINIRKVLLSLHYFFVGFDRYRRYLAAKREASNGSLVIFDRYPFVAPLDGPEIHLIDNGLINSVSRILSRAEQNLYKNFKPVDLLILLEVSLETSLRRKPDHPLKTIREKNVALNSVKSQLTKEQEKWKWVTIDTDKPFEDVLLHLKELIWAAL